MKLIKLVLCITLAALAFTARAEEQMTFAYAPYTMNNPFWLAVLDGVKEEADKVNVKIVSIDPQNDQARMNDQVGDLVSSKVDAIMFAPIDSAGAKPALEIAKKAGIPVINFDNPVVDQDLVVSVVASDNFKAGVVVGEHMMKQLPKGSKIAVLHLPSGQVCIDRVEGFYKTIGNYFEVVTELDGKGDTGVSLPLAEDILQSTPDLKAFFAVNDPSAIGCIMALKAHPEFKGVLVYGVDGSPNFKKLIEKGDGTATAAQSPITVGKETFKAAYKAVKGEPVQKKIDVPTFLITKENLKEYGVDGWQ